MRQTSDKNISTLLILEPLFFFFNVKQELSDWITSEYSCVISKGHALSQKETGFLEVVKR